MSSFRARLASLALVASLGLARPALAQSANATSSAAVTPDPSTSPSADEIRPIARPLMWTGATVFSATYLASAIGATTAYDDEAGTVSSRGFLWIPIAGPFLLIPTTQGAGWDTLLALDGVAQIAGLAIFTTGLALKHMNPKKPVASALSVSVAPLVTRGASGAALIGTF
jgi:hypothetical protein